MGDLQLYLMEPTAQFVGAMFDTVRQGLPLGRPRGAYTAKPRDAALETSIGAAIRIAQSWRLQHERKEHMLEYTEMDMASCIEAINTSLIPTSPHAGKPKSIHIDIVRPAIVSLLWMVKDAITFFESPEGKDPRFLEQVASMLVGTHSSRAQPIALMMTEWRSIYGMWKNMLEALDTVYMDGIFHPVDTLCYMAQADPHVFWLQFWTHAATAARRAPFEELLATKVAAPLVHNAPNHFATCRAALQQLFDSRGADAHGRTFSELFNASILCRDLIESFRIQLVPLSTVEIRGYRGANVVTYNK